MRFFIHNTMGRNPRLFTDNFATFKETLESLTPFILNKIIRMAAATKCVKLYNGYIIFPDRTHIPVHYLKLMNELKFNVVKTDHLRQSGIKVCFVVDISDFTLTEDQNLRLSLSNKGK